MGHIVSTCRPAPNSGDFGFFDRSPNAYIRVDSRGIITAANPKARALFGIQARGIEGHSLANFIVAGDREILARFLREESPGSGASRACCLAMLNNDKGALRVKLESFSTLSDSASPGRFLALEATTEQSQGRTELADAKEKLRSVTREMEDLIGYIAECREEERQSIERDIHDDLGQQLTALSLGLAWIAGQTIDHSSSIHSKVLEFARLNTDILASLQSLTRRQRPKILEDEGFEAALKSLVDGISEKGGPCITVVYAVKGQDIGIDIQVNLFRIAQECLSNILRHARARHGTLKVWTDGNSLMFSAEDDGRGISAEKIQSRTSWGIIGMRQRTLQIGGRLSISSIQGRGTKVMIEIPIAPQAA
jgi:signal transduction histidine kinase